MSWAKKLNISLKKKSNPYQVDINQENSSDEMTTIFTNGSRRRSKAVKEDVGLKVVLKSPKRREKGSIHQPIQTNQCLQVLVSPL